MAGGFKMQKKAPAIGCDLVVVKKKKKTWRIMDFVVWANIRVDIKESGKNR